MKKRIGVIVVLCMMLFMMTACEEPLEGTWYEYGKDPDDTSYQLVMSEDGYFIKGSTEGNWSVSDDKIMLMSTWDSETLSIVKENGYKNFIEEDGTEWIPEYEKAKAEYERLVEEWRAEQAAAEAAENEAKANQISEGLVYAKENLAGKYFADESYVVRDYILELCNDGTYKYYSELEEEIEYFESGNWVLESDIYNFDEERNALRVNITLEATETDDEVYEYRSEDGIDVILQNLQCVLKYDSERNLEEMYLEGDGFGFSTGSVYVPGGKYLKE